MTAAANTCHICGAETRRQCVIRFFKKTWRKKITITCPNCGSRSLTLFGTRFPGDEIKLGEKRMEGGTK